MKKIYQKPYVLQVLVNVENTILAGSPGLSETQSDPSQPGLSRDDEDLFADE